MTAPDQTVTERLDEDQLLEYVEESFAYFDQAARTAGVIDRFFDLAGYTVRLRFAGPAMEPHVVPALAHLETAPVDGPALTVLIWDKASTGAGMPAPPWTGDTMVVRGEIQGISHERVHVTVSPDCHGFNMLHVEKNQAVFSVPAVDCIPSYEHASPLRTIFHWWLSGQGRQMVHGGVVGQPAGGVLLAGRGGSGKSVTSLTCLCAGMQYAGDDYSIIGPDGDSLAYSLYSSAKLKEEDIHRFPVLAQGVQYPAGGVVDKAVVFIREVLPAQVVRSLPVKAILLPRVIGTGATRVVPASAAYSLRALAPSTIFQLPGAGKSVFECISRFVKAVPSYVLELGADPQQTPEVISKLIEI